MSFLDSLKKKILDRSDMYNFYKNGYERYKLRYDALLNAKNHGHDSILMGRLYPKINELVENNKNLQDNLKNLNKSLEIKITELDFKENEIDKLVNNLDEKNFEIESLCFPYHNFDEFLAESYVNPLMWSPFNDDSKRCLAFMEHVADYFNSKAINSPNQPLISVIMPVYNRKDVVMNAIESVLNQTYENFELVVVDDASTDGTTELLKLIDNDKVKIIFHESNKYASGARNTGLKNASGEIIAYLDSDNLLDERYLAATVGAFLELPDADAIYSAQYRCETYDSTPFAVQFAAFNKSLLHNHNFIDMNCFAHKREVYENIGGFDETLKGADDWELILRVSNHYKIYSIPFLLSKCFVGIVENRVSDLIPTDKGKIRSQNEMLPTISYDLNKKVNIIIPIYHSSENLKNCIKEILSLKLRNLKIIVSNNSSNIDLTDDFIEFNNYDVVLIQNNTDYGFADAVNNAIEVSDNDADILLLSKDEILTEGSLESLQEHAYDLLNSGLLVSQQVLPNGSLIPKHVPYALGDYWCDITPSKFYKNIINVPLFHDGEVLELNLAPFFCTYIKREILNELGLLDSNLGKHYHSLRLLSEYVRHIMGLKIYHISESVVINNMEGRYRNTNPQNDYDYNFKENRNFNHKEKYYWDF